MPEWTPANRSAVEELLEVSSAALHPEHLARFKAMLVPLYKIRVASDPGQTVFVVAEYDGKVIYYSDIEDGWELAALDDKGGIDCRGSSQFDLSHLMWQLFGDPKACG